MRAVISGVTAGVVLAAAISTPRAQPQQPDLAHAKELYDAANQAMNENRFDDAAQGYGAAYDITHDPILFFKIGVANEKAGHCDTALIYFGRYIKEAKPELKYQQMAQDHIRACHGDARDLAADQGSAVAEPAGSGSGSAAGSASVAEPAAGSGSAAALPETGSDAGSALAPAPLPEPRRG